MNQNVANLFNEYILRRVMQINSWYLETWTFQKIHVRNRSWNFFRTVNFYETKKLPSRKINTYLYIYRIYTERDWNSTSIHNFASLHIFVRILLACICNCICELQNLTEKNIKFTWNIFQVYGKLFSNSDECKLQK